MTSEELIQKCIGRDQALAKLWAERAQFEKKDKLVEFEQLEKDIKQVETIKLTVPLDLNELEMQELADRIRKMLKKNVFLDFRVDPNIIGGCIFVWQGMVHDYSLKKTIENKKGEFTQLVRNINLQ